MKEADLRAELLERFRRGAVAPLVEAEFERLALAVFRHQFEHNAPYRAYCERQNADPHSVKSWTEVPSVPTAAFKELPLVAGDPSAAALVFRTSGTTRGRERRGAHHVLDPALYEAAATAGFAAFVAPDIERLTVVSLVPAPRDLPDSSLAYMIDLIARAFGDASSVCVAGSDGALDVARLVAALERATAEGRAVALLGTTLSFTHALDLLEASAQRFRLAPGSRLMDTGGTKGGVRAVDEAAQRARYERAFGIPQTFCVNEYGMTELLSQCYDRILYEQIRPAGRHNTARVKAGPPWLRTRVMDPETLRPVQRGRTGILQHFDLANLDSVAAVQTEDLGRPAQHGFVLSGRASGAPPRGCSIAMDLLMEAARST
ncbi:MAG: long-chain fatty acid--CoA ligase [Longimicrobiales bacterium]